MALSIREIEIAVQTAEGLLWIKKMCANIAATQTSGSQDWQTPAWLFNLLNQEFNFDLDACADDENALCDYYFTEVEDGLKQDWFGTAWANPPYKYAKLWIEKAYKEAKKGNCTAVLLIGARPDTRYWWDYVRHGEVRFLKGRLKFDRIGGASYAAPFPSAIAIFRKYLREEPKTVYWQVKEGSNA